MYTLFLENEAQTDIKNYRMMLFMSKQVGLPKISSILLKMKISPKPGNGNGKESDPSDGAVDTLANASADSWSTVSRLSANALAETSSLLAKLIELVIDFFKLGGF